ncbi:hypothetical protein BJ138DRAFT_1113495 [Hygrophoropsis aurantiaca]|uniref:Uncharacterized protein n=1 Tax=Hygrophoropsis aurantiaca TaxID=72124 RepID=A0ACB8AED7_9AGAM|nr:hypothetical protein BJ138DRAFT_1113495 [Hygrophoropsis aurantiaca]
MGSSSMDTIAAIEQFSASSASSSSSSSLSHSAAFVSPSHSHLWHIPGSVCKSTYIAHYSQGDCPSETRWNPWNEQRNPCGVVFYNPYPSPPSSSSSSKSTVPLPEEIGEFHEVYSIHSSGVLDSPTVMRREELSCHKPLTPPPTLPLLTLELPDSDRDAAPDEDENILESSGDDFMDDDCYEQSAHTQDYSDLPLSPISPTLDSCHSSPSSSFFAVRPEPPSEDASSNFFHPLWSPESLTSTNSDFSMDDELPPLTPSSLQESSSLLESGTLRPFLAPLDIPWHHHNTQPDRCIPSSPRGSLLSLSDTDDISPPQSPSILHTDLPDLDEEDVPRIVPSPYLDEDLLPAPVFTPSFMIPLTPTPRLLLIDDPQDVPLPRSPSPEDFDLGFSADDASDPELTKLIDLRKRSVAAERAARRYESIEDQIDLSTRAEVRRIRKKEKERSKEVGALLRIKLGDKLDFAPRKKSMDVDSDRRHNFIGSISQLVAQMVFRRNDLCKPISKRKASASHQYIKSSLSRPAVTITSLSEAELS